MALTRKQKIIGGVGVFAALGLIMSATASAADPEEKGNGKGPRPKGKEEEEEKGEGEEPDDEEEEDDDPVFDDEEEDKPDRAIVPDVIPDDEDLPEDDIPADPTPSEILIPLLSKDPKPGTFFLMEFGHTDFSPLVQQALNSVISGSGSGGQGTVQKKARIDLMKCMSMSPWNRQLYGAVYNFSSWTSPDDTYIGRAWMPWHEDAVAAILENRIPKRGVSGSGSKIGGVGASYGLLWIPLVNTGLLDATGRPGCMNLVRQDGTSGLMPPKDLLEIIGWD